MKFRTVVKQNGFYNDKFLNFYILILSLEYFVMPFSLTFFNPKRLSHLTQLYVNKYEPIVRSNVTDPFSETLVIVVPVGRDWCL